jgi:hypothetical protein
MMFLITGAGVSEFEEWLTAESTGNSSDQHVIATPALSLEMKTTEIQ